VTANGYETYRLNKGKYWLAMPQNSFFHRQTLPEKTIITFQFSQQNKILSTAHGINKPNIIISPSGEISRFDLFIGTANNPRYIEIEGKNQHIVLRSL
jgi:general secretion pathway protein H